MELHDVGRRIVGRYWWLIVLLVVAGAAAAAASRSGETAYTASARVVLDAPDPSTRAESAAIADTVRAIATSPSQVRAALRRAKVTRRDPVDVAEHDVSVRGLGSSAVVTVSVSDRDRYVAANVANALAARVIATRRQVTSGGVSEELGALNKRIDELSAKIASADATIDKLNLAAANAASAQQANDLRARRDEASRRRDFLAQQRGVLESSRVNILGTSALRPKPSIISRAAVPLHADSSGRWPYMILGGLLGLVLGLGLAALAETFRPTIVGDDALARELDTPLLGTLRGRIDDDSDEDLAPVAARVRLAADAAGLHDVAVLPVKADVDLQRVVERLQANPAKRLDIVAADAGAERRPATRIHAFDLASPSAVDERRSTGLVLLSPSVLKKTDIIDLGHLLRVTPMPLLGLITYRRARLFGRRRARRAATPAFGAGSGSASAS